MTLRICALLFVGVWGAISSPAQLGTSAVRVLGQPDLRQNSFNAPSGSELAGPTAAAFDLRGGELHLYVVDRQNRRVLGWRNVTGLASGATADIVLGQFTLSNTGAFGIGPGGFSSPSGIAVDAVSGDVYISDDGAHRITRFRNPFAPGAVLEPDKVYGQATFFTTSANPDGVSAVGLRAPTGLTFDAEGNLWVADSLNNRVLRYPASSLEENGPAADLVLGQSDFGAASINAGGAVSAMGVRGPESLAFDAEGTLYVADAQNSRVLVFPSPHTTGQTATKGIGQTDPTTASASAAGQPWSLRRVTGVAISSGALYAVMPEDHRVLVFESASTAIGRKEASSVIGQADTDENIANTGSAPKASANGLLGPRGIAIAPDGTVAVVDSGNNRVTLYKKDEKVASQVLGQADFINNAPNRVGRTGMGASLGIAVDYSREGFPIYASDLLNHRVLAWSSSLRFNNGAPADLVIGQANFETSLANGGVSTPSQTSLDSPRGIAVSNDGDLFVADSGNNRVLRFQKPFEQNGQIRANLVLGQTAFFTRTSAFVNPGSMNNPTDVEIGSDGRVYVSDTGNHRVLEFAPNLNNGIGAVRVFGQASFQTGASGPTPSAQTFNSPRGIAVDELGFLYVADAINNRVLLFPLGPETPAMGAVASHVIGQSSFELGAANGGTTGLRTPADVVVSPDGVIRIADAENHRVLEYQGGLFLPSAGAAAVRVFGQANFNARTINYNSTDGRATAQGLFQPSSLFLDRNGMLYVGDGGNNRIVEYVNPAVAVSAATFLTSVGVAAGSLASVFGVDFTTEMAAAATVPLPTQLAGVTVEMEGASLPLIFVSPTQINLQIPPSTPIGSRTVLVRKAATDELIGGGLMNVSATRPGLFTFSQNGIGFAVAVNEDGTFNSPENPASRGSVVTLYGTGQGPTDPVVPAGEAPPNGVLVNTVAKPTSTAVACLQSNSMCVLVGSKFAETLFSGLAPTFVGLWQLNVRLPAGDDVLTGPLIPIKVLVNQAPTNDNVFISIQ